MHSIKARLLIWILFALLLVLGATGLASYRSTQAQEEQDYQALWMPSWNPWPCWACG